MNWIQTIDRVNRTLVLEVMLSHFGSYYVSMVTLLVATKDEIFCEKIMKVTERAISKKFDF